MCSSGVLECFSNDCVLNAFRTESLSDGLPLKTSCFSMDWTKQLLVAGISGLFLINVLFKDKILKEHKVFKFQFYRFLFSGKTKGMAFGI